MKPETTEWVDKAEGDWTVARREMAADDAVHNVVCFLAQQCAEKYIKAVLEEHGIPFPKAHDLVALLSLGGGLLAELDSRAEQLAHLSTFGIGARYPGVHADRQAAEEAMATAEEVRSIARQNLGLVQPATDQPQP